MDKETAVTWARALSHIPQKVVVNLTLSQKQQILWHALYHHDTKGKRDLLNSRQNWWLLLLMTRFPDLDAMAIVTEQSKQSLVALYKHYTATWREW